jgi:hypothetical protein
MKITFKSLRGISEAFGKGDDIPFIECINSFDGDNIYKKFLNILKSWEMDVTHNMTMAFEDTTMKVSMEYVIKCMSGVDSDEILQIEDGDWIFWVGSPSKFTNKDGFDLTESIKNIQYLNSKINFNGLSNIDKESIIKQLPANVYNTIIRKVLENNRFVCRLDNPKLSHISINFLNNSAYNFLKGLFEPYDKDYYRDIIYYLSKKIDGDILLDSTMTDIEYYIEKMNEENSQKEVPDLY